MRAGEIALGVWLPLAMADMLRYLAALCGAKRFPEGTLDGWGLTDLADALRRDVAKVQEEQRIKEYERLIAEYGNG